jgi:hypothetical protein
MDNAKSLDSSSHHSSSFDSDGKKITLSRAIARSKKTKYKKPAGKPKRPLSAYNIFFKEEREKLIKANLKVGFSNMAKQISAKWKDLSDDDRKGFISAAQIEQHKYREAIKVWKLKNSNADELTSSSTHSLPARTDSFSVRTNSLLAQANPVFLRQLLIEQQMIEQQHLMRAQMENAVRMPVGRRMSMPLISSSCPTILPSSYMHHREPTIQLNEYQAQEMQKQQQFAARMGRRFSMPISTSAIIPVPHEVPSEAVDVIGLGLESHNGEYESAYASSDETSLDDEAFDMLVNMPIIDLEDKEGDMEDIHLTARVKTTESGTASDPVLVTPLCPRRSSMPLVTSNTDWNIQDSPFEPTPMLQTRRLSIPLAPKLSPPKASRDDYTRDMKDLFDMLDHESVFMPSMDMI